MKPLAFLLVTLLTATFPLAHATAEDETGFQPIFNGKDLTGWEGRPGWWYVEDGAITAHSSPDKPGDKTHYLMWRGGKPSDFELRLEYRLVGTGANSGIQFRSCEVPDWDTSGYQADMETGEQWTGCLFEHTRGGIAMRGEKVFIDKDGKKTILPLDDTPGATVAKLSAELLKKVKKDGWNAYTIRAKGSEITLSINGVKMTQVTDLQDGLAARSGIIALQMHQGPPMKVQFRNLRLKTLD